LVNLRIIVSKEKVNLKEQDIAIKEAGKGVNLMEKDS
jgi:hypothetical protein